MELVFRDINVHIGQKQILKDVCGMAKPGKLLAIMGPSGQYMNTICLWLYNYTVELNLLSGYSVIRTVGFGEEVSR